MNRSTNAVGKTIPACQLPSRDLEGIGEAESSRSAGPPMRENRAGVNSLDGNSYDKDAPAVNLWEGTWRWDIRTDTTFWSEQLCRILGWENTTIPPFREHFRFYTSESWIRLVDATLELLKTRTPYELKLETLHTNGNRRWVLCEAEPVANERGEIVELRGTVQDITESVSLAGKAERGPETESAAEDATRRLIQAQEEESARLLAKFRDRISHRLALLAAQIESFRSAFADLRPQSDSQVQTDTQMEPIWQETGEILGELDLGETAPTVAPEFTD